MNFDAFTSLFQIVLGFNLSYFGVKWLKMKTFDSLPIFRDQFEVEEKKLKFSEKRFLRVSKDQSKDSVPFESLNDYIKERHSNFEKSFSRLNSLLGRLQLENYSFDELRIPFGATALFCLAFLFLSGYSSFYSHCNHSFLMLLLCIASGTLAASFLGFVFSFKKSFLQESRTRQLLFEQRSKSATDRKGASFFVTWEGSNKNLRLLYPISFLVFFVLCFLLVEPFSGHSDVCAYSTAFMTHGDERMATTLLVVTSVFSFFLLFTRMLISWIILLLVRHFNAKLNQLGEF